MYLPETFEIKDERRIRDFICANSFATIITETSAGPFASHLPLVVVEGEHSGLRILGHMARENPQWKHFAEGRPVLAIFAGPHTYISPSWYVSFPQVPTWNYTAVHVYGHAKCIDDQGSKKTILSKMVEKYEEPRKAPWKYQLPDEFDRRLISGIVGFEISVDRIEAKFKISQNRKEEDRRAVMEQLAASPSESERALFELMREHYRDVPQTNPWDVGFDQTVKFVLESLPKSFLKILDVGCGRGGLTARLRDHGHKVVAIDPSDKTIDLAKSQGIDVKQTSFSDFESDELFDAVIFSRSLHHLYPLEGSIEKARNLLKAGGALILEEFGVNLVDEPTAQWFYQTGDALFHLGFISKNEEVPPSHRRSYLSRWRWEHVHEPPLHSSEKMLAAVRKYFQVKAEAQVPYLYRYFAGELSQSGHGHAQAQRLFELEESLICNERIKPIGFRAIGVNG